MPSHDEPERYRAISIIETGMRGYRTIIRLDKQIG